MPSSSPWSAPPTVLALPILGICRGMQVLNVARGGALHQHLPDVVGEHLEHRQPDHGSVTTHRVETAPHTRLRSALGGPVLEVNSFHHQAVRTLGKGLVATAWAEDGTIEAIEHPGERLILGVQWHAEGLRAHAPLFNLLVEAAAGAEERVGEARTLAMARAHRAGTPDTAPASRAPAPGGELAAAGRSRLASRACRRSARG